MLINKQEVQGSKFAFDGCHKIYVCETVDDEEAAEDSGYEIRPIQRIERAFINSCSLRFISNWALDKHYVRQGDHAVFEGVIHKVWKRKAPR